MIYWPSGNLAFCKVVTPMFDTLLGHFAIFFQVFFQPLKRVHAAPAIALSFDFCFAIALHTVLSYVPPCCRSNFLSAKYHLPHFLPCLPLFSYFRRPLSSMPPSLFFQVLHLPNFASFHFPLFSLFHIPYSLLFFLFTYTTTSFSPKLHRIYFFLFSP